jgi:molybdenum cofactor biosynthesis enzyme MoaA
MMMLTVKKHTNITTRSVTVHKVNETVTDVMNYSLPEKINAVVIMETNELTLVSVGWVMSLVS